MLTGALAYTIISVATPNNLQDFGTKRAPQLVTRVPAPLITAAMAQAIRELLVVCPSLYIDELVWFCYDEFNVMVSVITTVSRSTDTRRRSFKERLQSGTKWYETRGWRASPDTLPPTN